MVRIVIGNLFCLASCFIVFATKGWESEKAAFRRKVLNRMALATAGLILGATTYTLCMLLDIVVQYLEYDGTMTNMKRHVLALGTWVFCGVFLDMSGVHAIPVILFVLCLYTADEKNPKWVKFFEMLMAAIWVIYDLSLGFYVNFVIDAFVAYFMASCLFLDIVYGKKRG